MDIQYLFNRTEKCAIINSVMIILGADHDLPISEQKFLEKCFKCLGLENDQQAFNESMSMADTIMFKTIKAFNEGQKDFVKHLWISAIGADQKVANEEVAVFIKMANECNIDISDFI